MDHTPHRDRAFRIHFDDGKVPCQRERRAWQRHFPREKTASLSWATGSYPISIGVTIQDIGGGGAAVTSPDVPPAGTTLHLWVGPEGKQAGPVKCRVVGFKTDIKGIHTLHLSFTELCPMSVFEVAMGLVC
jgi:hypothetical protein